MDAFLIDLSERLNVPKKRIISHVEKTENEPSTLILSSPPSGYILEYGEFGARIEMVNLDYEYKWPMRAFKKEQQLEFVNEGFKILQKFFPAEIQHIMICPTWIDYFGSITATCNVLSLGTEDVWYTEPDLQKMPEVGKLDITKLLNSVTVKKGLALIGPKELRTDHKTMTSIDWLKVNKCQWMRVAHLKRLQNKVIRLSDVTFLDSEIREFLTHLKSESGNDRLQVLRLEKELDDPWKIAEVMKGLKATLVESQTYSLDKFDKDIHVDFFLPPSDGKTIDIVEGFEFFRNNKSRVVVEFQGTALNVFVFDRKSKKRVQEEESGRNSKRARFE
uniref:FBA_2 domain-containing protein n=1 Tax=Caenorhabditis tropicalis TaxID=1561998 RepID=A0A1I7T209_9PELO